VPLPKPPPSSSVYACPGCGEMFNGHDKNQTGTAFIKAAVKKGADKK